MFETTFKNIDDVLWKDAGCSSELDYVEQSSWILFLKYLDDLDRDRATAAELKSQPYTPILKSQFQWNTWACPKNPDGTPDHHKALTGKDLLDFVNDKLFPYLQKFSYTIDPASPLAAGTYTFQTTQDEDAGTTGTSAPQTFTVALQDPSAPTDLTPTAVSPTEIGLSWDSAPADFIAGYTVYVSSDDGATFTDYADLAGTASSEPVTGLTPHTPYEFNVVATNDSGSSPDQITTPTWTQSGVAAPTDLTATAQGFDGIYLHWTDNSIAETNYQVEIKWAGTSQFQTLATLDANTTSYRYGDFPTEDMTFRVRAVADGQSAYSSAVTCVAADGTDFIDDGDSTGLSLDYTTDPTAATLDWTQTSDPAFLAIEIRKPASDAGPTNWADLVDTGEGLTPTQDGDDWSTAISWNLLNFPAGTQLAIYSIDDDGNKSFSNIETADNSDPPLDAPTLTATLANSDCDPSPTTTYLGFAGIRFSWTPSDPDASYGIYDVGVPYEGTAEATEVATSGAGTTSVWVSFDSMNAAYSGAEQDVGEGGSGEHYFDIMAQDSSGYSNPSAVTDLSTAGTPTGLTAKAVGNTIQVAWNNNPFNESSYTVAWSSDLGVTWDTHTTSTDVPNYTIPAVIRGATYSIKVLANRTLSGFASPYTSPISVVTPNTKLEILWEGANITDSGGTVLVHTGDDITGKTIDYLAGQHISLKVVMVGGGLTGAVGVPAQWYLGGSTGGHDFVTTYTPTPASHETGKLIYPSDADLKKDDVSFYCVVDDPNHAFTVDSGDFTATTTFNIKKPGHSIWSGAFTTTASQSIPTYDPAFAGTGGIGDNITFTKSAPAGQTVFLIQLANVNIQWWTAPGEETLWKNNTNGELELDNFYPYPYAGDHPQANFPFGVYIAINQQDSFEDWLMWQPPGGDSIAVPILAWSWNWSAYASWVGGVATIGTSSPTTPQTINATLTDSYPTWGKVLLNTT